jgi:hypothetical protein
LTARGGGNRFCGMGATPLVFVRGRTFFADVDSVDSGCSTLFHGLARRSGDYLKMSLDLPPGSKELPLRLLCNRASSALVRVPSGEVTAVVFPECVVKRLPKVPKSMWRPAMVERVYETGWAVPAIPPSFLSRDYDLRHEKWIVKHSKPPQTAVEEQFEFVAPARVDAGLVSVEIDVDGTGCEWDLEEFRFSLQGVVEFGAWPTHWGVAFSESAFAAVADAIHKDFFVIIPYVFEPGSSRG